MNRLQLELDRLYLPRPEDRIGDAEQSTALIGASGQVRAMVMELARPAGWEALSKVWHGVQEELELPAPAIAVTGVDGLQLWFSLAEATAVAQAWAFLEGLRKRYLSDVDASRVRLMPAVDACARRQELHAARVPAQQKDSENWSAFLAPDLVPVFAETPWLDIPPNEEGQATLLRGLEMITPSAFAAVCAKLGPTLQAQTFAVTVGANGDEAMTHDRSRIAYADDDDDARQFLLQVMNDATVDLALRIEAARVLLLDANDHQRKSGG